MMHTSGPFVLDPAARGVSLGGKPARRWSLSYGLRELAQHTLSSDLTQDAIRDAFSDDISDFVRTAREQNAPARIDLIDYETGDAVAHFYSNENCGMTPGLIDDRSRYWLRSENLLRSRDVTLTEFSQIAASATAPARSWIAALLPDAVLASGSSQWRAPTNVEIRHVVGEGSFTGISGAKAADLVGVTASNFRKYTARDGASTRQPISFAMWHLLLHKLGVQRA